MLVEKYGWAIQKSIFAETNQDSSFSHTNPRLVLGFGAVVLEPPRESKNI